MAKDVVINVKVNLKKAEKEFERLGDTIEEQKQITIEFEEEILRLERRLAQTSKKDANRQRELRQRIDHVKDSLKDQRVSLKKLNQERTKVGGAIKDQKRLNKTYFDSSEALTDVNRLTAEFALKVKAVKNITNNAIKSVKDFAKAQKVAFAASVIGILILALTTILFFWEDIKEAISGVNRELQKNIELSERRTKLLNAELDLLKSQEELLKLKGKSTKDNIEQQNILLGKLQAEAEFRLNSLQTQLNSLNASIAHISVMEKLNLLFGVSPVSDKDLQKAEELRLQILETQKLLTNISKELERGGAPTGQPILDADGRPIDVTSTDQTTSERERSLREQIQSVSELQIEGVQETATNWGLIEQSMTDELDAQSEKRRQIREAELEHERAQNEVRLNAAFGLAASLSALGEEGKAFAIAGIIIEQVAGAAVAIQANVVANAKALAAFPLTFGQPWVTINTASTALGIAAGAAAAAKAISKIGGGGSAATGFNVPGGGQQAAPSFNVVGTSGVNQIAQSLSQQDEPIQAFVVGSNVTTQQALDRNIVTTATIG